MRSKARANLVAGALSAAGMLGMAASEAHAQSAYGPGPAAGGTMPSAGGGGEGAPAATGSFGTPGAASASLATPNTAALPLGFSPPPPAYGTGPSAAAGATGIRPAAYANTRAYAGANDGYANPVMNTPAPAPAAYNYGPASALPPPAAPYTNGPAGAPPRPTVPPVPGASYTYGPAGAVPPPGAPYPNGPIGEVPPPGAPYPNGPAGAVAAPRQGGSPSTYAFGSNPGATPSPNAAGRGGAQPAYGPNGGGLDPSTMRASTANASTAPSGPAASAMATAMPPAPPTSNPGVSTWASEAAAAPVKKPTGFRKFLSVIWHGGSGDGGESRPYYRDPSTGRTDLPNARPWENMTAPNQVPKPSN
jgi:hypothetical protein